jgi:glutamyl/glutaminyl-tRNA synthetase
MRFEDTDKARNKPEAYISQLDILKKLGLDFDEGPYRQSERMDIYKKYLKELVASGLAYESEENTFGTGKIVRLRTEKGRNIIWNDLIKGEIKINIDSFKANGAEDKERKEEEKNETVDIVIARNIEDPVYHFTVVLDDWLTEITHVLRGEDHVTSTPRQILIFEALQKLQEKRGIENGEPKVEIPRFGHQPTILGENRKKLGKRNGAVPVREYFERGYLSDALLNHISLMGWNPGGEQEIFTRQELIEKFSLDRVQTHPAIFNENKLDFINKGHLDMLSAEDFFTESLKYFSDEEREMILKNIDVNRKVVLKVLRERVSKFPEMVDAYRNGEVNMFFKVLWDMDFANLGNEKVFDMICFKNKNGNQTLDEAKNNLKLVLEKIENEESWTTENLKNIIWDWSATVGRGQVLHPLRMIMSLKEKSPDPFTIMDIIGKEESLRRIKNIF